MKTIAGWAVLGVVAWAAQAEARPSRNTPAQVRPPSPASASGEPVRDEGERPWAHGVSAANQARALEIFKQGNALFEESKHAEAATKYKEALAIWDHPAIRYNLAVALIHLDQPLIAYENLLLGLKFGAAPLGNEVHNQALTYQKLLLGRLAELKVTCATPGAQVSLDGEPLFTAPGEARRRMIPGRHQLVATKPSYLTETRALTLFPGDDAVEKLQLTALKALATKRRWAVWKPPVVLGAGVLVAAIGVPLILSARSAYSSIDNQVNACDASLGCPPGSLAALRRRGDAEYAASIAMFAAGGAVAATGLILVILNQPRVIEGTKTKQVSFAPVLGPGIAAGRLAVRF